MKKILGITGGIGSGKSFVADLFAELGATVVDADRIAREILEPNGRTFESVVKAFGTEILKQEGTIDRKRLAEIVFSDQQKLLLLNGLTHPAVVQEMQKQINHAQTELVCLDVPLLFTCDFPILCHKTLAVISQDDIRVARVMKRDGCTKEEVENRMKRQLTNQEFEEKADFCVYNNGDECALGEDVLKIYHQVMES